MRQFGMSKFLFHCTDTLEHYIHDASLFLKQIVFPSYPYLLPPTSCLLPPVSCLLSSVFCLLSSVFNKFV